MLAAAEARQSAGGGEPTQGHRRLGGTIPGPRRWEGAGRQEPRGEAGREDTRTERGAAQRGSRERRGVGVEIGKGLGKRLAGK
jgi:hypothetical protein